MKSLTTLMLALAVTAPAFSDTMLYQAAMSLGDQKITLRPWGSGTIAETDEASYTGNESVRVSTKNLFQGGIILFGASPNLSSEFSNKNDLLRITFKIADASTTLGSGGGISKGGNSKGNPTGGGGGGASGAGINPGQKNGGGAQTTMKAAELKNIRLVITTTDGMKSETYLPADVKDGSKGWRQIGIPLQAISGFDRTNKTIASIAISADSTGTFWIGDVRTVNDTTPITGDVSQTEYNLATGDQVTLSANGDGGASLLKYTWSFDAAQPDEQDAEGRTIVHKFRKPGDYTVTVTISDYYGLKQPYKTQIHVKVN